MLASFPGATTYGVPLAQITATPAGWTNLDQITVTTDIAANAGYDSLSINTGGGVKQLTVLPGKKVFTWTYNNVFRGLVTASISPRAIAAGTPAPLPPGTLEGNPSWNLNVQAGDANRDGKINTTDYNAVKTALGASTTVRTNLYNVAYDLDGDGKIAANDLVLASANA